MENVANVLCIGGNVLLFTLLWQTNQNYSNKFRTIKTSFLPNLLGPCMLQYNMVWKIAACIKLE